MEKNKKRKREKAIKIAAIAVGLLLCIGTAIALHLLNKNVWVPAKIYESANELYSAEEYLSAYEVYISLGDYKDCAELAADCITKNAQKLSGREDVIMGTTKSMPWFKIDENGGIFFDEDKYKGASTLIIPDVFDNKLVMAIGDKGFFYADLLEEVILPPSVKRIESQAFFACSGLKKIEFPEYVEFIGEKAFEDCTSLSSVTFSAKLTEIGTAAFRNCDALTEVSLPEGFLTLGARSFASCEKLAAFSFPSTITLIGNKLFDGNKNIVSVSYNGTLERFKELCSGFGNDTILNIKEITCKDS
ncbi:MAG: leucine-rich repeat domain-containing protein [Clostridia bacterium]|nr:leucine-rich repeat domain-containing protein [Clostridia bacterium]